MTSWEILRAHARIRLRCRGRLSWSTWQSLIAPAGLDRPWTAG